MAKMRGLLSIEAKCYSSHLMRTLAGFCLSLLAAAIAPQLANSEEDTSMSPTDFVREYERALATQTWDAVSPLIHQNATVTFSNGAVFKGKNAVRIAYENNFDAIKNEDYRVSNIHWVLETKNSATYTFDFQWAGMINGKAASGAGRGTTVLFRERDKWQLIAEHLGPYPKQR